MTDMTSHFASSNSSCRELVDNALDQMQEADSLSPFHNIYAALIHDMRNMNCLPFHETTTGPQVEGKIRIHDMLMEKTLTAIANASSGCRVDQALRDLRHFQTKLGARCSEEQLTSLIEAVDTRTRLGMEETDPSSLYHDMWKGWRDSCLRHLGGTPTQLEPSLSLAA